MHDKTKDDLFYKTPYRNRLPLANRAARTLWLFTWALLGRLSPPFCFRWRRLLLQLFGATLDSTSLVYPSTRIWAPWNLTMGAHSCLGPEVDCYNVAHVALGADVTVSMRTFLCTASHDIHHSERKLITGPIMIQRGAFVFAEAFIGMNVVVGEGAVVAARAVVVKSIDSHAIVAGNPARVIGQRQLEG
jgi:putative colanic acid biosynthesis acetyltransferase WcaF